MGHEDHRRTAPDRIGIALITVSDTRTPEDDESGSIARDLVERAGHAIREQRIVRDDPEAIRRTLLELAGRADIEAVLLNGGTGISQRDRTCEAVAPLLDRRLDGFGELFRALSYQEIGPAAMLSRAVGGIRGRMVIFAVPGSPGAVALALERLILPELGHILAELAKDDSRARRERP